MSEPTKTDPAGQSPRGASGPQAAGSGPVRTAAQSANSRPENSRPAVAPMVFGGALAAFLGFGGAWVWLDQPADNTALIARIAELESQIAALPEPPAAPDLSPLAEADDMAARQIAEIGTRLDAGDGTIAAMDERLTAVERAPAPDGTVTETAITSLEREIAGLRTEIDGQNARLEEVASGAAATLAANAQEAQAAEAAAAVLARATQARAALAQVSAALDTGTPYAEPLAALAAAGHEAPAALAAAAETGVPSIATLQSGFPDAARAAVDAARAEDGPGGLLSFFDGLTQRRSVAPRDGDDVDAIQSRAEDALRGGRLTDALAELDALPEGPAAAFADWRAAAQNRIDAQSAIAAIAAEIDTLSPQNP